MEAYRTKSRFSVCYKCGVAIEVPCLDPEPDYGGNAAIKAAVERLFTLIVCDECCAALDDAAKGKHSESSARMARSVSYGRGWMPQDALCVTFDNSVHYIEDRSPLSATAFLWGRNWLPSAKKPWGYLMGPKGTGKSFLARCVANRAISLGMTAREIEADTLQKAGQAWVEGDKFIKSLEEADVLIIEEIGIPQWVEAGVVALRKVVDHRWRTKKILLVTSNLTPEEMRPIWQRATERNVSIYDSMNDRMRAFARLTLDGCSLRVVERDAGDVVPVGDVINFGRRK